MKRTATCLIVLGFAGCVDPGPTLGADDVVGPYSGEVTRYVVDRIEVPSTAEARRAAGVMMPGAQERKNALGLATATLAQVDALTAHAADQIAAGIVASSLEIRADNLANDASVEVWYRGSDRDQATPMGGTLVDGRFRSNRTMTTAHPGSAQLGLPIIIDADPIVVQGVGMQLDLYPDGAGGYDGVLAGGLRVEDARASTATRLLQAIERAPQHHLTMQRTLDTNHDGILSADEVSAAPLFQAIVAPDLLLFAATGDYAPELAPGQADRDALSFGFRFHVTPCADGRCLDTAPAPTCFDRVRNGDEPAVDCGGSCALACPADDTCQSGDDCQTGACDSGRCRAPTCDDGLQDGVEADVDCGGTCGRCDVAQACVTDVDCTTNVCSSGVCR